MTGRGRRRAGPLVEGGCLLVASDSLERRQYIIARLRIPGHATQDINLQIRRFQSQLCSCVSNQFKYQPPLPTLCGITRYAHQFSQPLHVEFIFRSSVLSILSESNTTKSKRKMEGFASRGNFSHQHPPTHGPAPAITPPDS